MESRRKVIRNTIRDLLKGNTRAGDKVFTNLSSPNWREQSPVIIIYTRAETVEELNVSPREYRRTLELAIEITAEGSEDPNSGDNVEDTLDDIVSQVELILNRDETLGEIENSLGKKVALVDALILGSLDFTFEDGGQKPAGAARIIFNVVYHENMPGSLDDQNNIGNMKRVHVDWNVGHNDSTPDEVIEAQNDLEFTD